MAIVAFFFLFLLVFNLIFLIKIISDIQSARGGAPYVPIPVEVARQALKLAEVNKDDIFYDLGCGDGRTLRLALSEFGAKRAVGYEVGAWPLLKCKVSAKKADRHRAKCNPPAGGSKLNKIEIHNKNLFEANLRDATVVFLYLYPKLLEKLVPKLADELPVGARIITCRYPLPKIDTNINDFKIVKTGEVKGVKIWVYKKQKSSPQQNS